MPRPRRVIHLKRSFDEYTVCSNAFTKQIKTTTVKEEVTCKTCILKGKIQKGKTNG